MWPAAGRLFAMGTIATYVTDWVYVWLFIVAGAALVVVILLFSKLINPLRSR